MSKEKIIFIDWGIFLFRAIFAWRNNKEIPATYTCLNIILSHLKKIGISPLDKIIIAVDSKEGSWRKEILKEYKANRKEFRESFTDIDWEKMYADFKDLLSNLNESTPFNIIEISKLEADDIIAVGCQYFKDNECIIVSYDKDYEQLLVYDNVKIFSPHPMARKCPYKILSLDREKEKQKAYSILASKINKETSDNLNTQVTNETEFDNRNLTINLLELPNFVKETVENILKNMSYKNYQLENLKYKTLQDRFMQIYNSDKIISYQDCINKKSKKKK